MSIITEINNRINLFQKRNWSERPTRIILGYLDWENVQKESGKHYIIYDKIGKGKDYVCGLEVVRSKRPRYIRILPKKLEYRKKSDYVKKYTCHLGCWEDLSNSFFPLSVLGKATTSTRKP